MKFLIALLALSMLLAIGTIANAENKSTDRTCAPVVVYIAQAVDIEFANNIHGNRPFFLIDVEAGQTGACDTLDFIVKHNCAAVVTGDLENIPATLNGKIDFDIYDSYGHNRGGSYILPGTGIDTGKVKVCVHDITYDVPFGVYYGCMKLSVECLCPPIPFPPVIPPCCPCP